MNLKAYMASLSAKEYFAVLIGGAAGGVAGYLIADLICDRVIWGEVAEKTNAALIALETGDDAAKEVTLTHRLPDEFTKPPLSDLVREYGPRYDLAEELPEVVAEIQIVSKALVDRNADMTNLEVVYYYHQDQVYAFEDGTVIDDPNSIFVPNVHLKFGQLSDNEDIVYVWNAMTGRFYEILRVQAAYNEEILGEEPKRKKKSTQRNRQPGKEHEVTDEVYEDDGPEKP